MSWRVLLAVLLVTGLVHAEGNDPLPTAKPVDVGLSSGHRDGLAHTLRGDVDRRRLQDMMRHTAGQLSADVNVDRLNNVAGEHIAGYGFGLRVAVDGSPAARADGTP